MKTKLLAVSFIFLLMSLSACMQQSKTIAPPVAVKGILDLTNWNFEQDGPVNLAGEYEFYWNQLITPQDFTQTRTNLKTGFISDELAVQWRKSTTLRNRRQ